MSSLSRAARLFVVGLVVTFALPAPGAAQQRQPQQSSAQQQINLRDADIRAFIEDVSSATGYTFIVDPAVTGRVSIMSPTALSKDEVFQVFLSTLRVHGYTVAPVEPGVYKIVTSQAAGSQRSAVDGTGVAGDQFITQVFQLEHSDADAVMSAIRPLVAEQGVVSASPQGDVVIVADFASNLERIRRVIAEIDHDGTVIETIQLKNMSAAEVARAIEGLRGQKGEGPGETYSAIAVGSTNAVIVRGTPREIARLKKVIANLDRLGQSNEDLTVISLRYAKAEELVPILRQIAGAVQKDAPASQAVAVDSSVSTQQHLDALPIEAPGGGLGGTTSIAYHAQTNSLIINADPETQRALASVIRRLDVRRPQVLVEAIIVEISDSAARDLGLQFLVSGTGKSTVPFAATNFSRTTPNILALTGALAKKGTFSDELSDQLKDAAIRSLLGVDGFIGGGAGVASDGTLFGVVLTAIDRDRGSNILSTPSLVTLDNEPASIIVGQEIPITTGESLGSDNVNPFRTIERRNVGVQLDIRPQISEGDSIRLNIRQEVSSIFGPVSEDFQELVTNKREIETTVLADDGEVVVLGGLIQDDEQISVSKVPYLGDIPVLGTVFRSRGRTKEKTNLMVFLRPTIVRSAGTMREVTDRKYSIMRGEETRRRPIGQSRLDRFLRDNIGAEPPEPPAPPGQ